MTRRRNGLYVSGYAYEPVFDPNRYGDAIRAALKSGRLRPGRVAVGMSGGATLVQVMDLPSDNGDGLDDAVLGAIGGTAATDPGDLLFDYHVLDSTPPRTSRAVVVAARRSELEPRLEAVKSAGLAVDIVDAELVALSNAYEIANAGGFFQKENEPAALVDFGATKTLMLAFDGARRLFREFPVGGNSLTEMLADRLGSNLDAAEEKKCKPGYDLEIVRDAIYPGLEELAAGIRAMLDAFAASGGTQPETLFVSGGLAGFPGIAETLGRLTRTRPRIFGGFGAVEADLFDAEFLHAYAHEFPLAFGLACHAVN